MEQAQRQRCTALSACMLLMAGLAAACTAPPPQNLRPVTSLQNGAIVRLQWPRATIPSRTIGTYLVLGRNLDGGPDIYRELPFDTSKPWYTVTLDLKAGEYLPSKRYQFSVFAIGTNGCRSPAGTTQTFRTPRPPSTDPPFIASVEQSETRVAVALQPPACVPNCSVRTYTVACSIVSGSCGADLAPAVCGWSRSRTGMGSGVANSPKRVFEMTFPARPSTYTAELYQNVRIQCTATANFQLGSAQTSNALIVGPPKWSGSSSSGSNNNPVNPGTGGVQPTTLPAPRIAGIRINHFLNLVYVTLSGDQPSAVGYRCTATPQGGGRQLGPVTTRVSLTAASQVTFRLSDFLPAKYVFSCTYTPSSRAAVRVRDMAFRNAGPTIGNIVANYDQGFVSVQVGPPFADQGMNAYMLTAEPVGGPGNKIGPILKAIRRGSWVYFDLPLYDFQGGVYEFTAIYIPGSAPTKKRFIFAK